MAKITRFKTYPIIAAILIVLTVFIGVDYHMNFDRDKKDSMFEHFYGPARVPLIPEELFPISKHDKKFIIYDCSEPLCGGLGDRQEGIVAGYLIAHMMGRKFRMRMSVPCQIENFLDENKESWVSSSKLMEELTVQSFKAIDGAAWKIRESLNYENMEKMFSEDVVMFMVNQEFVQYLQKIPNFSDLIWARNRTVPEIYNIVLRRLFKFKPTYQKLYDNFQNSVRRRDRQLVCAHIRLHTEKANYRDDREAVQHVEKVWSFLKIYNDSSLYRIFVATNSEQIRSEAKGKFPEVLVDIDGPIIHVDLDTSSKNSCEGLWKSLVDQMILSSCDVLFLSDSGFSRVAAMLRGTDENMFSFKGRLHFSDEEFIPPYW